MSNLLESFKDVQRGKRVESNLLVPLMQWFSGKEGNIEAIQKINRRFLYTNHKVLIVELALTITAKGFMKFPKRGKEEYPKFYINDLAKYFDSTDAEIYKTLDSDDLKIYREEISLVFGYDNKQRKLLNLTKRGINNGNKKRKNISRDYGRKS